MFTLLHFKSWAWLSKPTIQVHFVLSPMVKFVLSPHWSNLYSLPIGQICTLSPLVKFVLSPHWSNLYSLPTGQICTLSPLVKFVLSPHW